jgi:hypothetical protein
MVQRCATDMMIEGSSPGRCWELFSSSPRPDEVWVHPASYPVGTRGSFLGLEADHSLLSSAEVKNAWSYASTHPVRLHGTVRS